MNSDTAALYSALDRLTRPGRSMVITRDDGQTIPASTLSLWDGLMAGGLGGEANSGGSSGPGSRPPIAPAILDIRTRIETAVSRACADRRIYRTGQLPADLRAYVDTVRWEDDQPTIDASTQLIDTWCAEIETALGDTIATRRMRGVRCISCGAADQRITNSEGEPARAPAIALERDDTGYWVGAKCQVCGEVYLRGVDLNKLVANQGKAVRHATA